MAAKPIEVDLFEDVLMGAVREIRKTFRVALPGKVQSFTRETTRTAVALAVRFLGTDRIPRDEPIAADLPVILPRGGGYGLHLDLREGDPTVVLCQDGPARSYYETGDIVTPQFPYGHQFGTGVAFPGGRVSSSTPGNETPPPNSAGTCLIGAEDGSASITFAGAALPAPDELGTVTVAAGGPSASLLLGSSQSADPVACANEVLANLQALNTAIQAWVPLAPPAIDNGATLKAIFSTWFAALQPMADLKAMVDGPVPLPP
jgi:hypothetical protein